MRLIGHLPDRSAAELFGDYLLTRGMPNEVERDGDVYCIWIADDGQLAAAQAEFAKFQAAPNAPEFQREARQAERIRAEQAREDAAYRRRVYGRRRLFPSFGGYGVGWATYALLIGCGIVAFYSQLGAEDSFLRHLFIQDPLSMRPGWLADVRGGEVWRLFTPMFIHYGPLHLIFNGLWLFQLGCMIEARRSSLALVALVLVIAAVSNLAQYYGGGPRFGGMSGVVYGLFGFVWIRGKLDRGSGLYIDSRSVVIMIVWFFACLSGMLGPIANLAHAAGLALGMIWGALTAWHALRNPE